MLELKKKIRSFNRVSYFTENIQNLMKFNNNIVTFCRKIMVFLMFYFLEHGEKKSKYDLERIKI